MSSHMCEFFFFSLLTCIMSITRPGNKGKGRVLSPYSLNPYFMSLKKYKVQQKAVMFKMNHFKHLLHLKTFANYADNVLH